MMEICVKYRMRQGERKCVLLGAAREDFVGEKKLEQILESVLNVCWVQIGPKFR